MSEGSTAQQEQARPQQQTTPPAVTINARVYSEGLQPGQPQRLWRHVVATLTLLAYCGTVNIIILLALLSVWSMTARVVLLILWSTLFLPARPLLWPAFNRAWIFATWREYFRFSYYFEEQLDMSQRYILVEVPHGVYPIAPVTAATLVQALFPGSPVCSLAASAVFHVPVWKHFMTWIGSLPASRANFLKLLQQNKTVGVVVGGIAEMFMVDKNKERTMLRGRKGFVRAALETGTPIVPVYYFGQSQLFRNFGPPFLARLSRKWRTSIGVLVGRWLLPLPRPIPVYLVHGKPIPVNKVPADSPEFETAVDELHQKAVDALHDLYLRHRAEYGWPDRPLSIE